MEGKENLLMWVLLIFCAPIAINLIMIFQDNMGYSKLAQGLVGVGYLALMGVMFWRNGKTK